MTKEIKVNRAVVAHLKQKFEVTQQAVWYALHFVSNSTKAVMIREEALRMGGVYTESGFVPTCSIEETPEGFRQIYAGGVVLTVNIGKSTVEISRDGKVEVRVNDVTLDALGALAMEAQRLGLEGRLSIPA